MPPPKIPRDTSYIPDPNYVKLSERQRKNKNEKRRSEAQIAARETLRHNPHDAAAMGIFQQQRIYHNKTSLVGVGAVAPEEARLPAPVVEPLDSSGVDAPDVEMEDAAAMNNDLLEGLELGDESDSFSAYNDDISVNSSDDESNAPRVIVISQSAVSTPNKSSLTTPLTAGQDVTSAWSFTPPQHSFIHDMARAARPLSWWCKPRTYIACDFETSRIGHISQVGFASVHISQDLLDRLRHAPFLPSETDFYHLMTRDQLYFRPGHWDVEKKYRNDRRNVFGDGTSKVINDEDLNECMRQEILYYTLGQNQDDVCLVLHDARAEPSSCRKHKITALDDFQGFVDPGRPQYGYFKTLDTQAIFASHPRVGRRQPGLEFLVETLLGRDRRECHNALNDAGFTLWLLCLKIYEEFQG
ncbi:hypothetical protein BKA64DRAFT_204240 [Cadophora sp. MPI-SDFR-AT-0126]|nr:hypothetical protein BKA64DRAFT_204240 [Leotiomycetes sp. MPI-SDFR-AT-0126]